MDQEEEDYFDSDMEEEMDLIREIDAERNKETKSKKVLTFSTEDDDERNHSKKKRKKEESEGNSSLISLPEDLDTPEEESWMRALNEKDIPRGKRRKKTNESNEPRIFSRIPTDSDYQAVTVRGDSGRRFYLKLKPETPVKWTKRSSGYALNGLCYERLLESALRINNSVGNPADAIPSGVTMSDLWVEKYKPRNYFHLLSDDGTNRTLLSWLKLWDKVVFNKKVRVEQETDQSDEEKSTDATSRPSYRVVLLYGNPGLGKTTLAHVVAKHAGYNIVEMNASDDRSLAVFKTKLEAATQMKSVTSADQRPNCLIIDEIDGSPAPTVKYLVNFISDKKKKRSNQIQRPIICICNDLFTPALRPLRQIALVISFPRILTSRLVQRLFYITQTESIQTDLSSLLFLCEKNDNDVRACLSTLQFFKSRPSQMVKLSDINNRNIGQKDAYKSYFSVWNLLFELPRYYRQSTYDFSVARLVTADDNSVSKRYRSMLDTVYACGDYNRVMDGVFENYLDVKFKDSRFENVNEGLEWFLTFDVLQQYVQSHQSYTLMGYLSFPPVAMHFLFASGSRFQLSYPKSHQNYSQKLTKSQNLIMSCFSDMLPGLRSFLSNDILVRDTMPILLQIIRPTFRSVNTQLFSSKEKETLKNAVSIMVAYNLNYLQECQSDGQYIYAMDPCIDEVVEYPGIPHVKLSYSVQQLISHEINLEKMRRLEPLVEEVTASPVKKKPVKIVTTEAVDFFGRPLVQTKVVEEKKNDIVKSDIWFKFKEGYNNAVRRTLKISDFI